LTSPSPPSIATQREEGLREREEDINYGFSSCGGYRGVDNELPDIKKLTKLHPAGAAILERQENTRPWRLCFKCG
jgi:hypothetical protein